MSDIQVIEITDVYEITEISGIVITQPAIWGQITGNILSQTDLINHLNNNFTPISHYTDTNNPHNVTASQIGTYNGDQIDSLLDLKADKSNVLELNNTTAFTPNADYEPATKKYVDDNAGGGGSYTDEQAQDAVGSILTDTVQIDLAYNDVANTISASVKVNSIGAEILNATSPDILFGRTVGTGQGEEIGCTAAGRNLIGAIDVDTQRTTLGISATNTPNTPAGNIVATNVQTAINELDTEKEAVVNKAVTMTGNTASDIKYLSAKAVYDWAGSAISWVATNGTNVLSHISSTLNPHGVTATQVGAYTSGAVDTLLNNKVDKNTAITGATKTKITYDAKGLVAAGTDATTTDITDSTNKRYVTDSQLVDIININSTSIVNSLIFG